jgi:hypothetical protein
MIKAEQNALVHEQNIRLLDIRELEMGYFQNFFGNFSIKVRKLVMIALVPSHLSLFHRNRNRTRHHVVGFDRWKCI